MQTPITVGASNVQGHAVAELRAEMYPRKLIRLTINGPRGSRAEIYLGAISPSTRIDQTARGASNTAEYSNPVSVPAGMSAAVVWPGMGAQANEANATFMTERN
jgi:hypothetical protein